MGKWHADQFVVAMVVALLVNAMAREIPIPKASSPSSENNNQTNLVHVPSNAISPNNTDAKNATAVKDKKCLIGGFAGVGGVAGVAGVIPFIPLGAGIGGVGGGVGGIGGVGGVGGVGGAGGLAGGVGGAAGGVGGVGGIGGIIP